MLTIKSLFITLIIVIGGAAIAPPIAGQEFSNWSPPVNLGAVVNTSANDQHPTISKDGLTLIFVSTRAGGVGGNDLYVTERDSLEDPWGPPANLTMLNTAFIEFAPELSTDGHWLYFHSDRPGGCGSTDIYATHRQNKRDNFGWEAPINLGCVLNTSGQDAGPTVFEDPVSGAFTMYINRSFTPADPESPDIYASTCAADISSCNRNQLWSAAVLVPELSYPGFRDTRMAIRRRDGLEMILTSTRPGGCGGQDLWVSTRATTAAPWSIPVNVDPINPITGLPTCVTNSSAIDGAMALSWDGTELYFFSNRSGGFGGNDLWRSTRTKLTGSQH